MKKVALYLRVSTTQQTVENQRIELEKYVERQGWQISRTYQDDGISGKTTDRPALKAMLDDAAKGKFAVLAVWKIDRLARSTVDLLRILLELKNHGVDFVSSTQAIDTTTSAGRMLVTFLGAIAEFERETIVDRVKSGLQRAKAEGVRLGRPRVGFDVSQAIQRKQGGASWQEVATELHISSATVRRIVAPLLKNPTLKTACFPAQ